LSHKTIKTTLELRALIQSGPWMETDKASANAVADLVDLVGLKDLVDLVGLVGLVALVGLVFSTRQTI